MHNVTQFDNFSNKGLWDQEVVSLLTERVFLAGGALRRIINEQDVLVDYDLFFRDVYAAYNTIEKIESLAFEKVYSCPLGYLLTYKKNDIKVQIIKEKYYSSVTELIDTFDIVACCAGTDGTTIVTNDNFSRDVEKKQITFNRVSYPVATLKRIFKYKEKGYEISPGSMEDFIRMTVDNERIDFRHYID